MKKISLLSVAVMLVFNTLAQVKIDAYGKVGIGNMTPAYKLDVEGTTRFSGWTDVIFDWTGNCCGSPVLYPERSWYLQLGKSNNWLGDAYVTHLQYKLQTQGSDKRLKKDIDTLYNILNKIDKVNVYSYRFNDSYWSDIPNASRLKYDKKEIGFIAQDLEKSFPDLVYRSDTGLMSVNYIGMIPILTQAIKEQQTQIEKLKNSNSKKTLQDAALTIRPNQQRQWAITLDVPVTTRATVLGIYNMVGEQISFTDIAGTGVVSVHFDTNKYKPGMYYYVLLADGNEIETRRFILLNN